LPCLTDNPKLRGVKNLNHYEFLSNSLANAKTDDELKIYLHTLVSHHGKGKALYAARKAGIKHRKALYLLGHRGIRSYKQLMKQPY